MTVELKEGVTKEVHHVICHEVFKFYPIFKLLSASSSHIRNRPFIEIVARYKPTFSSFAKKKIHLQFLWASLVVLSNSKVLNRIIADPVRIPPLQGCKEESRL